jgi:hypothetical protein
LRVPLIMVPDSCIAAKVYPIAWTAWVCIKNICSIVIGGGGGNCCC